MTSINIFKPPENEKDSARILADHMPQGRAWGRKNDSESNLNKLMQGLSSNSQSVQEKIFELATQFDISNTSDLIDEWEISVGIPDECVFEFTSLTERQQRVIQRLRKTPIVTLAELNEYIQAFFDSHTVTISTATPATGFEYALEMNLSDGLNNRFVLLVEIDAGGDQEMLFCLLRNVVPANVVIYIEPVYFSFFADTDGAGFGTLADSRIGGTFSRL